MREVVVSKDHRLVFRDAAEPEPGLDEVVIAVKAIFLNCGEVRKSRTVDGNGHRPGWDLAGIVERTAGFRPAQSRYQSGVFVDRDRSSREPVDGSALYRQGSAPRAIIENLK
ncbi:MAG: hypothetical protein WAO76_16770 [Georgfuchsia sp.]